MVVPREAVEVFGELLADSGVVQGVDEVCVLFGVVDDECSQVLVVLVEKKLDEVDISVAVATHKGEEGGGSDFCVVGGVVEEVVQDGGFVQAGTGKATR